MAAFARAIEDVTGDDIRDWDSVDLRSLAARRRDRLLRSLRNLDEDDRLALTRAYIEHVRQEEPELVEGQSFEAFRLASDLFAVIETDAEELSGSEFSTLCSDDVCCLAAQATGALKGIRYLLSPSVYWVGLPFSPGDRAMDCLELLYRGIPEGRAIRADEIVNYLDQVGVSVTRNFVCMAAASDARLLTLRNGDDVTIGRLNRVLPKLELAAHNVRKSEYVTVEKMASTLAEEGFRTYLFEAPKIDANKVAEIVAKRHPGIDGASFNWGEVGVKMLQLSLKGEIKRQGLSASLHAEIVSVLRNKREAMTRDALEAEIGLPVPLAPESLPPGHVMAYAVHPRFLKPESAYYVLKEWVETDRDKRGRILRDRIVTPFNEKNWEFSGDLLDEVVEEDELYKFCSIVMVDSVVDSLIKRIPGNPMELYYRTLIRKRVDDMLGERFAALGRGFFAHPSRTTVRAPEQTNDAWRLETLRSALGGPRDLMGSIERVEDERLRSQLLLAAHGAGVHLQQRL